ncbi:DUF1330 domain-containing protein [Burkholderia sp. Ac-20353]|uniref:DUF1330 domain-containing protein n=1 Tax=Burkholderia sp. Ac-20353 TaxID=2703894 RepID=UPI00197C1F97|nr:DUF1330 domain-containing protein [Burkholderia sp. Ac-20353]MBN3787451.1 DUF1330 domain-containing protein [Burkholderia sp. Ac-20353]
MAKGYWIALVDVEDPEAYRAYVSANAAAFEKYGGRFIVRGGTASNVEGKVRSRAVVVEFASYQRALDCFESSEYAPAKVLRRQASTADIVIVEGYEGP